MAGSKRKRPPPSQPGGDNNPTPNASTSSPTTSISPRQNDTPLGVSEMTSAAMDGQI
jgi:hypothetical protein